MTTKLLFPVWFMAVSLFVMSPTGYGEESGTDSLLPNFTASGWDGMKSSMNRKWRADAEECDNGYFTIAEGKPYCRPYQLEGTDATKTLNATAAQITFADRWVRKHCPLITIDPTYHMNYLPEWSMRLPPAMQGEQRVTARLNEAIRELHEKVGNAETEGYNIVIGNAATRFGWALVKDEKIAKRMAEYISNTQLNISVDTQLRAVYSIEAITKRIGTEDDYFPFVANELQARWKRIKDVFKDKSEWEIKNVERLGYILWLRVKNGNA